MTSKTLIIGACGQIGSELTLALRNRFGNEQVIASDIKPSHQEVVDGGPFEIIDALNAKAIESCVKKHNVKTIYLMAAMLSAKGEKYPVRAWDLNMTSLLHVLDLAKDKKIDRVFWPSSIAVFGHSTPKVNTPQETIMAPTTVYGISKLAGERWCEYYHNKYEVDVRSLRYPGIISWKTQPGGGTTDYAVDIFHKAVKIGHYKCFLKADSRLPMMYMDDAIKATIGIMDAPLADIRIRSSYNLAAFSFTPEELAKLIKEEINDFTIAYAPDFRQEIADSWPESIDDTEARKDWNWNHDYALEDMVIDMIKHLKQKETVS